MYISPQASEDSVSVQSSRALLGCTEEKLYTLTQTNEQLQLEVELLRDKLAIAEKIVEGVNLARVL
jgi:hypothetical protein